MKNIKELTKGFFRENPTFILVLGMCPTLGVSTSLQNAIGMGVAATFVLIGSNFLISLLKKAIPDFARIPCFIVIIASFVTVVQMLMNAYLPSLYAALGVYLPLIVVNCIILGRAEAFASKNSPWLSVLDAVGMGIGFTMSLSLISLIRESIGAGSVSFFVTKAMVPFFRNNPVRVLAAPAGALLLMGYLKAFFNWLQESRKVAPGSSEAPSDSAASASGSPGAPSGSAAGGSASSSAASEAPSGSAAAGVDGTVSGLTSGSAAGGASAVTPGDANASGSVSAEVSK